MAAEPVRIRTVTEICKYTYVYIHMYVYIYKYECKVYHACIIWQLLLPFAVAGTVQQNRISAKNVTLKEVNHQAAPCRVISRN